MMTANLDSSGNSPAVAVDVPAAGDITLPNGIDVTDCEFQRLGNDLQVTGETGESVVVRDYFGAATVPALRSTDGATLSPAIVTHLARADSPTQFAAAEALPPGQPIGRIHSTVGEAIVIRADGTREEIEIDTILFAGDVIETKDGAIGAILADETTFSMAKEGRMVLDSLVYDPDIEEGSLSVAVLKGAFTFVSGLASRTDPEAMTIQTPVATIGIRGTQLGLDLAGGNELTVTLMSEADGFIGEAVIINDAGFQVLNQMHMTTRVSSAGVAPAPIFEMDLSDVIETYAAPLLQLPLAHGRENDYRVQIEQGGGEISDFETDAGGDTPPTPAIKVIDGDYTSSPDQPPVEIEGHALPDYDVPPPAPAAPEPDEFEPVQPSLAEDFGIAVNFQPLAFDESVVGDEDAAITGRLTAVDADDEGLQFTLAEDGGPAHGAVDMHADGSFTYTPEADYNGTDSFTFIVDDGHGGIDTATVSVNVEPVPDRPQLSVTATAGLEDTSIPVAIEALVAGNEGLETITISGLPAGAILSLGSDSGDGSWLIGGSDLDDLSELTLTPASDWTGNIELTIVATSTDGGTSTAGFGVLVAGVPDVPVLSVASAAGLEDATIPLAMSATVPGAESLASVSVSGVPDGAALSLGTDQGDGVWFIDGDGLNNLADLTIAPSADWSGEIPLQVTATSTDGGTAAASLGVHVVPVPDVPLLSVSAAEGSEDTAVPISISATVPGNEEVASVTIAGVPEGATLSLGIDNGNGSWTIDGDDLDQLASLTVTPPADTSTDFSLHVEATSTDGGTTTADLGVAITPVADLPDLHISDVTVDSGGLPGNDKLQGTRYDDILIGGGGDDLLKGKGGNDILYGDSGVSGAAATVALDIRAAVADADTSESLSITLGGFPDDVTLSAGSDLGGGTWSLTVEDLYDLTMTLPAGFAESFQIEVTAISTDVDTDSPATDSVSVTATIDVAYADGEAGDDRLFGGGGDDLLFGGGGGEDTLVGGAGDDLLRGEGGDDVLVGGSGDDVLRGDGGDDRLTGGGGDDILSGGGGRDSFIFEVGSGADTLTDYKKGETLRFEGDAFSEDLLSVTQDGDHAIVSFDGQDVEVTLEDVDSSRGYTVSQEPDAIVVIFDDNG